MRRTLLVVVFSCSTLVFAQPSAKKRDQKLAKEMGSAYEGWTKDVAYIITDAEKQAFNRLSNDDERDQFIEQFWLRRDPTPDTAENEFKEEHYRRIAYANERFASGIPGWRTDRSMIYIKYGPPDEIESHASGGNYQRPIEQGAGIADTYPFEQWRYRYIDGIGTNVILEFVDVSFTGEYRLTTNPQEKDALQHTPGYQPPTLPLGHNQFDDIKLLADVQKPPPIKFKDLETAVNTNIRYNTLPIKVRTDFIPVTPSTILSNITIQFDRQDLQFQQSDTDAKAIVNLYARITTLARRSVNVFEDTLSVEGPSGPALYQKSIPLAPGKYRLSIAARDVVGGNSATYEAAIEVPAFHEDQLAASSLIIADLMERVPSRNIGTGQFVIGDMKVRPRVNETFSPAEKLGIYIQLYHLSSGSISYEITNTATNQSALTYTEDITVPTMQLTIHKWLPLQDLLPGPYTLRLRVTDKTTNQTISPSATFKVQADDPL
ncbi:MAG TPA: GWxTD domain-containing protein [Bryobacteraceae bacterium]|nr:GWxTD domain-containing protein [Bryobacteraceae bacterium]